MPGPDPCSGLGIGLTVLEIPFAVPFGLMCGPGEVAVRVVPIAGCDVARCPLPPVVVFFWVDCGTYCADVAAGDVWLPDECSDPVWDGVGVASASATTGDLRDEMDLRREALIEYSASKMRSLVGTKRTCCSASSLILLLKVSMSFKCLTATG